MSVKIYSVENYVFMDLGSDILRDLKYNISVSRSQTNPETYWIQSPLFGSKRIFELSDIQNKDGVVYTSNDWENFYTTNTGLASPLDSEYMIEVGKGHVIGQTTIHKFGTNSNIGSGISPVTSSGTYQTPMTAVQLQLSSSATTDTANGIGAQAIHVEGLNELGEHTVAIVPTDGTANVILPGLWLRVYRLYVHGSGRYAAAGTTSHDGTITVSGVVGGEVWGVIIFAGGFGRGQSQIGVYTIPLGFEGQILTTFYSVDANKPVDLLLLERQGILTTSAPFPAMRIQTLKESISGALEFTHRSNEVIPELTDFGFMASVGTGTASVSVEFEILLTKK